MTNKETGRDRGDGATRKAVLQQIAEDFPGNDTGTQRTRLHAAMRRAGSITTTEARLHLEIMNPSQRITELRDQGDKIDTVWTVEPSEAGRNAHRQARYVLVAPATCHRARGLIRGDLLALLILATVAGLLLTGVIR